MGEIIYSLIERYQHFADNNSVFVFIQSYIFPVIEVFFIAYVIYKLYKLLTRTRAIQVLKGLITILIFFGLAYIFQFEVLSYVMENLIEFTALTFIILFQPELRNMLMRLGESRFFGRFMVNKEPELVDILTKTVQVLKRENLGGLIVVEKQVGIKPIIETGTRIEALVSSELLHTIFFKNSPLHDGAVLISNGVIVAAGCILPLTQRTDLEKIFGTRHRAGIGLSEESDAVTIVVSEENGKRSIAFAGKLYYGLSLPRFKIILSKMITNEITPKNAEAKIQEVFHETK